MTFLVLMLTATNLKLEDGLMKHLLVNKDETKELVLNTEIKDMDQRRLDMNLEHHSSLIVCPVLHSDESGTETSPNTTSQHATPTGPVQNGDSEQNNINHNLATLRPSVTSVVTRQGSLNATSSATNAQSPVSLQPSNAAEREDRQQHGITTASWLSPLGPLSSTVNATDLNALNHAQQIQSQASHYSENEGQQTLETLNTLVFPHARLTFSSTLTTLDLNSREQTFSSSLMTLDQNSGEQRSSSQVPIPATDASTQSTANLSTRRVFESDLELINPLPISHLNSQDQLSIQVPIQASDMSDLALINPVVSWTSCPNTLDQPFQVLVQASDASQMDNTESTSNFSRRRAFTSDLELTNPPDISASCPNSHDLHSSQVPILASDASERDSSEHMTGPRILTQVSGSSSARYETHLASTLSLAYKRQALKYKLRRSGTRVPPRYPQYEDESARQRSFGIRSSFTSQQSAELIRRGFFHTGWADLVRCFQCGIGFKDWSPGDDVCVEHRKHSPQCPFLQRSQNEQTALHRDFMEDARQRNQSATSTVRHPNQQNVHQREATFAGWLPTNGHFPHTTKLAEAGLFFTGTNDLCRCFKCDGELQSWDKDDDPWIEHARWFPNCPYVREVKGQDFINRVLASKKDAEPAAVQGSDLNTAENQKHLTCHKCKKNYFKMLLLPCEHLLCDTCAENVTHCPVCGKKVEDKVKIYM